MTNDDKLEIKPGYVSWKTFITFLDTLKADGVPSQIDSSVLHNMSGTVQSQLRLTLQYLKLIDENFKTSDNLSKLAKTDDTGRKSILENILRESYSFLFFTNGDFDLKNASAIKFSEYFDKMGLTGETRQRAESFFLSAAKYCDIEVSKYITGNRGTRKKIRGNKKPKGLDTENLGLNPSVPDDQRNINEGQQVTTDLFNGKYGIIHKLQIEGLPKNGRWTSEEREKYLAAYQSLLDLQIEIIDNEKLEGEK